MTHMPASGQTWLEPEHITRLVNTLDIDGEQNRDFVRYDYSGRGMYDSVCIGFVMEGYGAIRNCMLLAIAMQDAFGEYLTERMMHNVRTDAMGQDTIVYFPRFRACTGKEDCMCAG